MPAMESYLVSHAIYAVVLFGVLEAMCVPISSELTFLLGGAVASGAIPGTEQHPSLLLVIVLGTLAELVGSYISYGVGRAGGKPLVHRWGRYLLITESDVARRRALPRRARRVGAAGARACCPSSGPSRRSWPGSW